MALLWTLLLLLLSVVGTDQANVTWAPEELKMNGRPIFVSEFEILNLSNHDGRLEDGHCCNGHWPRTGTCGEGNVTCLPYWKVCIIEQPPPSDVTSATKEADLSSKSKFATLFSKIFGATKRQDVWDRASSSLSSYDVQMSTSLCNVGFFTSDVISSNTSYPIRLKKPFTWQWQSTQELATTSSTIDRFLLVLVEIHSKNRRLNGGNEKISRQVFHYNIVQPRNETVLRVWGSQWYYGNRVVRPLENKAHTTKSKKPRRHDSARLVFPFSFISGRSLYQGSNHNPMSSCNRQFSYRFRFTLRSLGRFQAENEQEEIESMQAIIRHWSGNVSDETQRDRQVCPRGYRGAECDEPICLDNCHPHHGYCEQPGQCECRFGWTGMECNTCLTLPGCGHGDCHRPFECRCQPGWSGLFCTIPKCRQGCHEKHGYCDSPDQCKCRFGWQGENCTECSPLPGCVHGTCYQSLDCVCQLGWQGLFCSTPICAPGCENGYCEKPGECRCLTGWSGANCTECVRYPGCSMDHGRCHKPWQCLCQPGWTGLLCDQLESSLASTLLANRIEPDERKSPTLSEYAEPRVNETNLEANATSTLSSLSSMEPDVSTDPMTPESCKIDTTTTTNQDSTINDGGGL